MGHRNLRNNVKLPNISQNQNSKYKSSAEYGTNITSLNNSAKNITEFLTKIQFDIKGNIIDGNQLLDSSVIQSSSQMASRRLEKIKIKNNY